MTTTTKVVIGVVSAAAVGTLIYMYVNKKGVFKSTEVVAHADGRTSVATGSTDKKYPPHTFIKNVGWTDSQGKVI